MSVNKYVNGKLLQMSGNADTRLTTENIINILGYTPADSQTSALSDGSNASGTWNIDITGNSSSIKNISKTHGIKITDTGSAQPVGSILLGTPEIPFDKIYGTELYENGVSLSTKYATNDRTKDVLKADLSQYTVEAVDDSYGDFNNYVDIGIYVFNKTAIMKNTNNVPVEVAGTLIVTDYTGASKDLTETYAYRLQEFHTHDNSGVYKRSILSGSYAERIVGDWVKTIDTNDTVDTLTSTDVTKPLSANQGRVLSEVDSNLQTQIDTLNSNMSKMSLKKINHFKLGSDNGTYTISDLYGQYIIISNQGGAIGNIAGMSFAVITSYAGGCKAFTICGGDMYKHITISVEPGAITLTNPNGCDTYMSLYQI